MSKIVIALGGNALGNNPSEQLTLLKSVTKIIADLIEKGNKVVITHGNGPQVGQISLAMEYASNGSANTPAMPFAECGSMSQGYIGYHLQQSLQNELSKRGMRRNVVSLVTQVLVDQKDSAFKNPSKPIGMFYTKEEAEKIEQEKHYVFVEDAGRGYRRVVPSPTPIKIVEGNVIKKLSDEGNIVIAVGGGGIPVIKRYNALHGVEAVIDKDRSAALLARSINADKLLILTAVDKVSINYNTSDQIDLDMMTIENAKKYIEAGYFAKGSMLPKVEACMKFVNRSEKQAIISSLEKAAAAIDGKTGTIIKWR